MKTIPDRNLKIRHVIVDPDLQEHQSIPPGSMNVKLTDIVLETKDGNHEVVFYYVVIK